MPLRTLFRHRPDLSLAGAGLQSGEVLAGLGGSPSSSKSGRACLKAFGIPHLPSRKASHVSHTDWFGIPPGYRCPSTGPASRRAYLSTFGIPKQFGLPKGYWKLFDEAKLSKLLEDSKLLFQGFWRLQEAFVKPCWGFRPKKTRNERPPKTIHFSTKSSIFTVCPGQSRGPPPFGALRSFLVNPQETAQKSLGEAQKGSGMVWREPKKAQKWSGRSPKKRLRNGLRQAQNVQKWSGSSEPKKAQKWSGTGPKKLGNGLGEAQKSSEMVWEDPQKAQKLSG